MASSKAIWIPPLPLGWEARYDQSKRAYFFINHQTRTTQWEDPRFPQVHPSKQNAPSAAFQSLGHISGKMEKEGAVSLPLQEFNHSSHSKTLPGSERQSFKSESTFANEINMEALGKLHSEFQTIPKDIVRDILMLCHNNEREAREQLKDMCSTITGASSDHATPKRSTHTSSSGNANLNTASPKRLTTDPSPKKQVRNSSPHHNPNKKKPAKTQSPVVKPEIPEADKTRALNQLKNGFPNTDSDVIRIALNHCNFNIEEATLLVSAWEKKKGDEEQRLKNARAASTTGTNSSSTSVGQSFVSPSTSLEPSALEDAAANIPQGLSHTHPNSHRPGTRPAAKKVAPAVPVSESHSSGASSTQASTSYVLSVGASDANSVLGSSHHASAQHVTRMSEHLLNTTNDILNHLATTATCCAAEDEEVVVEVEDTRGAAKVDISKTDTTHPKVVTTQPTAAASEAKLGEKQVTMSSLRSGSKGPDPNLRKGPDSKLLTSDYTHANGPNLSLRSGPNKNSVSGSKGAQGPDASLRCGPQSSFLLKYLRGNSSSSLGHDATSPIITHV